MSVTKLMIDFLHISFTRGHVNGKEQQKDSLSPWNREKRLFRQKSYILSCRKRNEERRIPTGNINGQ